MKKEKDYLTMGFPIPLKENEQRRCLLPQDIERIKYKDGIYIETGYGEVLGIDDDAYRRAGVHIAPREEVLSQDIICDPKIGDAEYIKDLKNQVMYGWVHAAQNRDLTDLMIKNKLTAIAWGEMYDQGRHTFYKNNEMAGAAAVMHAFTKYGTFPSSLKVAVIGRGNTAQGAMRVLAMMGAETTVYHRRSEQLFREQMGRYDVIVNCVMWDVTRDDHLIFKDDLKRLKHGALIIDVSCDVEGAVETSKATTIDDPIYTVDGILHYVVDHTPSLFFKTVTADLSPIVADSCDDLMEWHLTKVLKDALIMEKGKILDKNIIKVQGRSSK